MIDLSVSRQKIDSIDREILHLFEERMKVSDAVAEYKRNVGKKVYDPAREEEKLRTLRSMAENPFNEKAVVELFEQIMSISRKLQYSKLSEENTGFVTEEDCEFYKHSDAEVVFYGTEGTHTQQAMKEVFGEQVKSHACETFRGVMEEVANGHATYGILPLENSSTGGISDSYDLLMEYPVSIVHEHILAIHQALLVLPGTKEEDIQRIYSHPQGILQCEQYLREHPQIETVAYKSTADSAKRVAEEKNPHYAAIAGKQAASCYGLEVLHPCINQENTNSTRFIVIAGKPIITKEAEKVSMCFELPHESGSLYHMLSHFIYNDLNMTMIESRPIPGKRWEYRFFVDVEGNLNWPQMQNACVGIRAEASYMKILGNYQSNKTQI